MQWRLTRLNQEINCKKNTQPPNHVSDWQLHQRTLYSYNQQKTNDQFIYITCCKRLLKNIYIFNDSDYDERLNKLMYENAITLAYNYSCLQSPAVISSISTHRGDISCTVYTDTNSADRLATYRRYSRTLHTSRHTQLIVHVNALTRKIHKTTKMKCLTILGLQILTRGNATKN